MKKILILSLCLISMRTFAAAVSEISEEISKLTSASCATDKAPESQPLIHLAYLRGSPVDAINDPQAGEDYLNLSRDVLSKRGFKVVTASAHHTNWESICRQFKTSIKKNADSRVVLVGHSYGSSGALKVANCLWEEAQTKTDVLITVSSFDFMAGVDVTKIPAHVVNHYNFSVDNPMIPGYKTHVAQNSEATKVQNIEAKVGMTHIGAAGKLLQTLSLITVAEMTGKASALNISQKIDSAQVNRNLAGLWNCQQAEKQVPEEKIQEEKIPEQASVRPAPTSSQLDSEE